MSDDWGQFVDLEQDLGHDLETTFNYLSNYPEAKNVSGNYQLKPKKKVTYKSLIFTIILLFSTVILKR